MPSLPFAEAGLLPPVCGLRAAQPLEVLQVAAEALQLHGSVNMVVVQAFGGGGLGVVGGRRKWGEVVRRSEDC